VKFFGHLLTNQGVKPDPSKVEAIDKLRAPSNVDELRSFIGMVTYLARYIPNLSIIMEPLRKLTLAESEFVWKNKEATIFENLKRSIRSNTTLAYFDVRKETTIQCDASDTGLGATLLQQGRPISFASKSLTETERNYAVIEKETLAVLFGCNRFS
jgi:hypothetical protein